MSRAEPPPEECANCGADIPSNAKACPECGADERTGWREASVYDALDLPDDPDEPEDESRRNEERKRVNGIAWYWFVVGAALIALLVLGALRLR